MSRLETAYSTRQPFFVFLALAAVYLVFASGYIDTSDADPSFFTSKALVEHLTLRADPPVPELTYYARGRNGGWYSKMGLLEPVLYLPAVCLAKAAHAACGIPELLLEHFFISLVNGLLTAAILALLYYFFRREGAGHGISLSLSLVAGFATYLFPYAKSSHRETLQALLLLGAFLGVSTSAYRARDRDRFLTGACVGLGLLAKLALIVPLLPPFLLVAVEASRSPARRRNLLLVLFPLVLCFAVWLTFVRLAFGSFSATGYGPGVNHLNGAVWSTPLASGIYQQLLSFRTGYFFYNPVLLLAPIACAIKLAQSRLRALDLCVIVTFIAQLSLYARWLSPTGHEALGPRYLVVVTPALFLLFSPKDGLVGAGACLKSLAGRALLAAVLGWSLVVQGAAVGVRIQEYWTIQGRAGQIFGLPHWLANLKILEHKLHGKEEIYRLSDFNAARARSGDRLIDLRDARTLRGLNFWWLHLDQAKSPREVWIGPRLRASGLRPARNG